MPNIKIEDINESVVRFYKMEGILDFISGRLYSNPYFPMLLGSKGISTLDAAKKWATGGIPRENLEFNAVCSDDIPTEWKKDKAVELIVLNGQTWLISRI